MKVAPWVASEGGVVVSGMLLVSVVSHPFSDCVVLYILGYRILWIPGVINGETIMGFMITNALDRGR